MKKIRFGVLSTARIGLNTVIPAMQEGQLTEVTAIGSANTEKATNAAHQLGIAKVHNSYEALLHDADVDAIYNPLPNHVHVDYTLKALAAGKHVLCEKPIGLNTIDTERLIDGAALYPHLKVMEAFMYRFHPQWQKAKQLVADGALGTVKHIQMFFSYYNVDAANIRNQPNMGGGALMDIGCYCISVPRFIFGAEPKRVMGLASFDANFSTDVLTSGLLDFGDGISASLTCSTQLERYQRVNILGDKGRLEIELPVNAHIDQPSGMWLQQNAQVTEVPFTVANQYTLQGDAFARAILDNTAVPTPLVDALANMRVIDALFQSVEFNKWELI